METSRPYKTNVTSVGKVSAPIITPLAPIRTTSSGAALPSGKVNSQRMLVGIVLVLLGFFIMSLDKADFGFGFLGLTLGPIVVMVGFIVEFFAILVKPKQS